MYVFCGRGWVGKKTPNKKKTKKNNKNNKKKNFRIKVTTYSRIKETRTLHRRKPTCSFLAYAYWPWVNVYACIYQQRHVAITRSFSFAFSLHGALKIINTHENEKRSLSWHIKIMSKVCRNEISNFPFERYGNYVVRTWYRSIHIENSILPPYIEH